MKISLNYTFLQQYFKYPLFSFPGVKDDGQIMLHSDLKYPQDTSISKWHSE
jgi:hypothetical protein